MKLYTKILPLLLISALTCAHAQDTAQQEEAVVVLVAPQVKKCACGPMEHWFFKSCVNKYIAEHADSGLTENSDSEGLPENILQAMAMIVRDISFVTADSMPLVPEINAKGNMALPMSKNPDFKLCREVLGKVDVATTLSAEELYQQWTQELAAMKSAQ